MNSLPLPSFQDFFRALWKRDPFPWQEMLAERVSREVWPESIDLPTAAGKTACLDIATYALAAQADQPNRTAARRIWFVVDRRIIVDEAFERARQLADKLENGKALEIAAVAQRLFDLRGLPNERERPLAVARLRGGVLRGDDWAGVPSQPAIITSTVDQVGSRLLFRGYGYSALAAPIYAGLAGNDSLIFLDEAHCAVPFLQTLAAVKLFREPKWSEIPNPTPFHVAVLSATPPGQLTEQKTEVFPRDDEERQKSLDHPILQKRLKISKRATLVPVKDEAALVRGIVDAAQQLVKNGTLRVGVMVNRVDRATSIENELKEKAGSAFDIQLLTGRIRAVERDWLIGKDAPLHKELRANDPEKPARPLIVVSTQCLEVGADFSFDALLTECASLDALRQRFGRLARLGKPESPRAFVFAAESTLKECDPIYGNALGATWQFLWNKADIARPERGKETRTVDFGFEALRAILPPEKELAQLLAPTADAPILLPAHLDLLSQTSPIPHPDPDISTFLHGKDRGSTEVRVAFRCDLDPKRTDDWCEIVSLCPPIAAEMLSVPLHRFRKWLRDGESPDQTSDLEGDDDAAGTNTHSECSPFVNYRGRENSRVSRNPREILPDSIILLPAPHDLIGLTRVRKLGQVLCDRGFGVQRLDVWELALQTSGKTSMLRIQRETLTRWLGESGCPPLRDLVHLLENEIPQAEELRDAIAAVRQWEPENERQEALPEWLRKIFRDVEDFRFSDIAQHPAGGIIVRAKSKGFAADQIDFFADEDDAPSEAPDEIYLSDHCSQVSSIAATFAHACLGEDLNGVSRIAGQWHDAGKLDPRFQEVLRGGAPDAGGEPLAKSPGKRRSSKESKTVAAGAGLPLDFRHEMLSLDLAQRFALGELSPDDGDLLLHLIASHHGHARPFAPVCGDTDPPTVLSAFDNLNIRLSTEERRALSPAHTFESGITDRFWILARRFGWWGLAYREAILRLADWYASAHPEKKQP